MICRVGDRAYRGRTVTIDADVSPAALAMAVREGESTDDEVALTIACRRPHPVHERVGCIRPGMGLRPRTALAGAGRARGLRTPVDGDLRAARRELAAMTVDVPDTAPAREAVAETGAETDRLREQVATARGRVQARRRLDAEAGEASTALAEAVADLSERETRALAVREKYERTRDTVREARDRLEARLELEDAVANLERAARRYLVERLEDAYAVALGRLPDAPRAADRFEAPSPAMALAIARVARFDAPVVVATDRFPSARAAARWLDAPVVVPTA